MRFNDGFWLLKAGVKAYSGLQVVSTYPDDGGYNLQVSTRPIRHRGDTLGGPVLSIRVHSPTEGVIGVRIDHFRHTDAKPDIALFPDAHAPPIRNYSLGQLSGSGDPAPLVHTLSSAGLTAEITSNPYTLTFKAGQRVLTSAGYKHQTIYDVPYKWTLNTAANSSCLATDSSSNSASGRTPDIVRYIHSELNLSPGELVYGLGEQFTAFVKNGQTVSVWNRDGGTSSEQAYKCVPFYITNRGYGVFINHPGEVEVEVASEKVSRVGVSVAGDNLEYFLIYGETPLQILERYTRITGRPALLPAWTFGLWLSTSFLTSYDSETVASFLEGMQARKCDVRVFHLDCFWMKGYEWCSFTFDPDNFPDPKRYLSEIKERYSVKICVWTDHSEVNPYISQLSPIFQEGVKGNYFIKRKDGTPWQWDLWQPGLAIVDFTNPEAEKWFVDKLSRLIDLGVDCFKTDFGERIPHANIVYHDGSDPYRMHNVYATKYNQVVFDLLKRRLGEGQAVLFARSAHAGGQRMPVHWGGDCESTFEAMAETLRGCLSITLSGFAFASHDIGGFEGHPPPEIYNRWVAFGLFSSHSRLHGSSSYRVPWNYGEEAGQYMAKFLDAKHRLMPYLYNLAIKANQTGHPLQRAMFLEFPEDRTTHYLDAQYMLGPSLLVAPVLVPEGEQTEYYLPAGRWTSFFEPSRVVVGPRWVREVVPVNVLPVWVREGTLLPLGKAGMRRPDYAFAEEVELQLYEIADGADIRIDVPTGTGAQIAGVLSARRMGDEVKVMVEGEISFAGITLFYEGVSTAAGAGLSGKVERDAKEVTLKISY
ncbi:glycosyl hydrolases family 31-domain-containing protein [Vararia minispora EC-137]|uniref:Glycosyl hydrolases family 31-domain-containing protein n=1 Tax=Vararia minispora EC-137 TaxID=1314806 RepID=A0ACB8QCU7_9AGAM|nr:glycosyl hydrolases family 31-domain-containing protein [Vararia minispora EC-137]